MIACSAWARIFREAGVAPSWLNCLFLFRKLKPIRSASNPAPSRFAMRIIPELPADRARTSLGVALGEGGICATISYPRVDDHAKERIASHCQTLGHAVAHEIAHLLLGPVPRARFGIMRGEWTAEDLESIAMGTFLFSPQESAVIRQGYVRFSASSSSPRVADDNSPTVQQSGSVPGVSHANGFDADGSDRGNEVAYAHRDSNAANPLRQAWSSMWRFRRSLLKLLG